MRKESMKTYEGMFLLDAGDQGLETIAAPVRDVLARVDAEVLVLKPWDERRLSYPIKGRKRGMYVLTYFRADPVQMAELQHEIHLNDKIVRALLLSADHLPQEKIQAETPATLTQARRAAAEAQKAAKAAAEAEKAAEAQKAAKAAAEAPGDEPPQADGPAEGRRPRPERSEHKPDAPEGDASKQDDKA